MPNTISSPNMGMPVPVPTVDPGPDYAANIVLCYGILDNHNHSAGSGVQITPGGLNINADLAYNNNNATALRSLRFFPQVSVLSAPTDLGCLYESGVDLYYNDGNGNQVRITQSGGVAGSPGSIGGLTSPASATYVSANSTFVWQSAASTPASTDTGPILLRKLSAASNSITLTPANALASNYTLTFPASLPGATSFLSVDTSGNLQTTIPTVGGITRSNLAALGQQQSSSCGPFLTTSTTFVDVTNLSVTLPACTGRPVWIVLQPDNSGSTASFGCSLGSPVSAEIFPQSTFRVLRDGTEIARTRLSSDVQVFGGSGLTLGGNLFVPANFSMLDTAAAAGSHTYTFQAQNDNGSGWTTFVTHAVLIAYET